MANWRAVKAYESKMYPLVYEAYSLGCRDGRYNRKYIDGKYVAVNRNPYPKGKRHDEYERGFAQGKVD